jgi:hypothetical protein
VPLLIRSAIILTLLTALAPAGAVPRRDAALSPETLHSVNALPAGLAGRFEEPLAFQRASSGRYFVFDRRGHTVYSIDAGMTSATRLLTLGQETGKVLLPFAFDSGPGELFAVGDAPGSSGERVQVFDPSGYRLGGFSVAARVGSRVQLDGLVLNGLGALRFTDRSTIVLNQPETGTLITEYDLNGRPLRTVGQLRSTGHESDPDLHLAFNSGLALEAPDGGFYFVFQAGEPAFRRYDAGGNLLFERQVQGRALDSYLQRQPTTWPRREGPDGRLIPVVRPVVRAAAVSPNGDLWVALLPAVTYVYDTDGEKIRIVHFRAAGELAPTSLFFTGAGELLVTPGCFVFRP